MIAAAGSEALTTWPEPQVLPAGANRVVDRLGGNR